MTLSPSTTRPRASLVARAVAAAQHRPGAALAIVLTLHVAIWTALPILLYRNLQLDLAEDLALGREWQLGYWKHPPLPWWLADLVYRLAGDVRVVYLLGPLSAAACLYAVWRFGREVAGEFPALLAVLALEGVHYYNFSVVKFAHDQMQLPFWALTGWFVYRAIARGKNADWFWSGVWLALAFWSKYAAFVLAGTIGLVLLLDPVARRTWRTPGPYLMGLAFLAALAPNLWWLVANDFMPFRYVEARAADASHWFNHVLFPLQWTGGQVLFLAPAIGLLALLLWGTERSPVRNGEAAFARRYLTALALGPFLLVTLVAAATGRLPIAMWGYPLWSFAPLAALMWLKPAGGRAGLRRFAIGFAAVFAAMPAAYAAVEIGEAFLRDRPKATDFPGRTLADRVTRHWRDATGAPLAYVTGVEFGANNVAVYSADRPRVLVHGSLAKSPWIDPLDLRRRGVLVVWQEWPPGPFPKDVMLSLFPEAEVQPALVLPRQTWWPRTPVRVGYAFVRPQPQAKP